ncbi:MAG TPA: protein translocase subunit SecD [Candidatus Aminicenantes bacterium]|nr:protein translocase subunit SecD [Candidatus Aminicenantes bacterium]
MDKKMGWKIILILGVVAFSVVMFLPLDKKINLGLDLKGGMHLILEVQTDEAIRIQTDQGVELLKDRLKEAGIEYESLRRDGVSTITGGGIPFERQRDVKDILDDDFRDWKYTYTGAGFTMTLKPNIEMRLRDQSVDQALQTIDNRVNEYGVAEPVIQKEGLSGDRLLIQLPGVDDPGRVKSLIQNTAMLEWKHVEAGPFESEDAAKAEYGGTIPEDLLVIKTNPRRMSKGFYVLRRASVVSGNDLKSARRSQDEYGAVAVGFSFNNDGARKFERYTAANVGKRLSIVLDDRIESVATIDDVISYGGILRGNFTAQEVDDLVLVLRSGALPAPLKYLQERTIGPSLGADSIRKGTTAALFGLFLVIVFMLVYYRGAGINSVVALVLNIIILLGILAYFRATLTLPGIAGIILTIGMAVDANVLVFERIKEELQAGKSPKASIDSGFKKAFVTIFDANVTTIIAAVFLFQFGTGPIKGFSVTLIIGILASMFTAVFVSRVIFDLVYGKRRKLKSISI